MKKTHKILIGTGVVVAAAGGFAFSRRGPKPEEVEVATVGREDLQAKVTANGKVQAKKKVEISATIPGQVTHLAVKEGDRVAKGQFLLQIDATNPLATARSTEFSMQALRQEEESARATLDQARAMLACESAGGAQHCLDAAVAWARQRVQFARPIGSFQAIKHRLASLLLEVECARSAAYWASWVASEGRPELPLAAALAKSVCDETFERAAEDDIHVHGGIGVTWEAEPHLYTKRARANATLFGTPTELRARIAELQGF